MEDANNSFHRISVPSLHGMDFIEVFDIMYCIADGNYVNFYMKGRSKPLFVTLSLHECEILLHPYSFFSRIHKSYLVNLNYAVHYEKGKDPTLILDDKTKTKLTVSRTHKKEFLEKWKVNR